MSHNTDIDALRPVTEIVSDLRTLGVPESALRPILDWHRHEEALSRFGCRTCKDTGWVPSGCECHDDPCPRCKRVNTSSYGVTCRHCGHVGPPTEDHSCPCPYSDEACYQHRITPSGQGHAPESEAGT